MARLLMITGGTLGDVLPMLDIGLALSERGHHVRVLAHQRFRSEVDAPGIEFVAVGESDPEDAHRACMRTAPGSSPLRAVAFLRRFLGSPDMPQLGGVARLREHVEWCDLVVGSHMATHVLHLAELLRRRWITYRPTPTHLPSREFAHAIGPLWWHLLRKPSCVNLATHQAWEYLVWRATASWTDRLRQEYLGLPSLSRRSASGLPRRTPQLVAATAALFPRSSHWPRCWRITGYPIGSRADRGALPDEVESFLALGSPPVFVGFSSTPIVDLALWTDVIMPAMRRLGCRAIVGAGWSQIPDALRSSASLLVVRRIPYRLLFPRVACVVHACGVGTMTEALLSGTPSVATPVIGEQKQIAARAFARGLLHRPCLLGDLSAEALAALIHRSMSDSALRARTAAASRAVRAEDGLRGACELVEEQLA